MNAWTLAYQAGLNLADRYGDQFFEPEEMAELWKLEERAILERCRVKKRAPRVVDTHHHVAGILFNLTTI